ncbi:hypothetical protein ASF30_12065 [Leifsonia sp. Leaf264]|nr:hypothetical protein ASF30_12065 [Leifsonia sp. Leaf264]
MDARSPYGLGVFLYAVTWLAFITIFVNAVLSFFPYFPHKELVMIAGAFAGAWVPFAALYLKLLGTRFGRNNKWLSAYIASPIVAVASTAFTLIGMWLLFAEAHLAGMAYCIYIPFFIWFLISGRAYLEDTVPYTTPSDDDRFAAAIPTASKVLFIIAIVVFVISLAAGALANVQLAAGIATAVAGGDAASVLKGAGIAGAIGSLQLLVPLILAWRGALPQIGLRSTGRRWLTVTVRIVGTLLVLAFPFVVPAIIAAQYMQLAGH